MNNKGFTLIELLAVVILLSIIVFLVLPNVVNLLKDKETEIDELTYTIIKDAAKLYIDDNKQLYKKISGNKYCISLNKLVKNGYLKENIKYNGKDITNLKNMKITYENGYNYELVDKNECLDICTLISGKTNKLGSKYSCEVKPGTKYNFYVLSNNEDGSSNLIMERNICEDGTLATETNKCLVAYNSSGDAKDQGPVTAITYLNNATSTWKNINNLDLIYDDEGENFIGFELNGKARMPYLWEVRIVTKESLWLINYLNGTLDSEYGIVGKDSITGISGYWTLASGMGNSNYGWIVDHLSNVGYNSVDYAPYCGVRPVITVNL